MLVLIKEGVLRLLRLLRDIRELKYPFEKGKRFFKKGEYELRVEQAMRYGSQQKIEKLHHILDVGLTISTHNE